MLIRLPESIPRDPPPADRGYPLAAAVLHSGCRWVEPRRVETATRAVWSLSWTAEPGLIWTCSGREFHLDPEVLAVSTPGTAIASQHDRAMVSLYASFVLGGRLDQAAAGIHVLPLDGEGRGLIQRLINLVAARGEASPAEQAASLGLIGWAVARLPLEIWPAIPNDGRIHQLCDAIDAGEGPLHANQQLARQCGLSTGRFIRLFTAATGRSPQAYQIEARLKRAAHLLLTSDPPLRVLAERLGFADRSHLTRRFRARFGRAPAAWRKLQVSR
ncbi:hypothetical protein LBMAG53_26200 [Planctomycetota bacterium]|nr:hypothetical protein LBMAG53_26200 [Planctomycetota bacterium]